MIIERRLKYIKFHWDDDTKELTITTYKRIQGRVPPIGKVIYESKTGKKAPDEVDYVKETGTITLGKVYLFSTLRFMLRISQRMWLRKPNKKLSIIK